MNTVFCLINFIFLQHFHLLLNKIFVNIFTNLNKIILKYYFNILHKFK